MLKGRKILIAAAGTGGHIYPAISLADHLRDVHGSDITFLGTLRGLENEIIPKKNYKIEYIDVSGFSGSVKQKLVSLLNCFSGTLRSINIIKENKYDIIVGAGGYISFPAVIAGYLLSKPCYMIEQNLLPGKVTKLLSGLCRKVFISFSDSKKYLKGKNVYYTGNPIRKDFFLVDKAVSLAKLNLKKDKFTILITGASQGALSINEAVLNSLEKWKSFPWQILHVTGRNHFDNINNQVKKLKNSSFKADYRIFPYYDNMADLYAVSDIVISRAGASTLSEIIQMRLPSALIPYPFAAEDHQKFNAKFLYNNNSAVIIEDNAVREMLCPEIIRLFENKEIFQKMKDSFKNIVIKNAAEDITKLIEKDM